MSVSKYKFVSPGVFINEIDNSQLPAATPAMGPLIIGRTERGPSMRPIKVNSFSEYIELFGDTIPGGPGGDVWREGNYTSPMYATYAAQAWLRNGQTATIVRLLGTQHQNYTVGSGEAGWGDYSNYADQGGGSYGLFLVDSGSFTTADSITGSLAAVWYFPDGNGAITLSGTLRGDTSTALTGNATFINQLGTDTLDSVGSHEYRAIILSGGVESKVVAFNFNPDSDRFIRKVFNTNPIATTTDLMATANQEKYWLGHTFEGSVNDADVGPTGSTSLGIILKLGGTTALSTNWSSFRHDAQPAKSGWIISQDVRGSTYAGFDALSAPTSVQKLFQFHALDLGEWANKNVKISIANVKASPNEDADPYGTFDVLIRRASDLDNQVQILEQYNNCNLNPFSPNYIARRIGDTKTQWDSVERRFRTYGDYPNVSKFVRVEVNTDIDMSTLLPFGFWGPPRPKAFIIDSPEATDGTSAAATIMVDSVTGINGRTLTLVDATTTGTTHTITINTGTATHTVSSATATEMGGSAIAHADGFAVVLNACLDAIVAAGHLNMTVADVSNDSGGNARVQQLTQSLRAQAGNTTIGGTLVTNNNVFINNTTAGGSGGQGTLSFLGGLGPVGEGGRFETVTFATSSALTCSSLAEISGGINVGNADFMTASFEYPKIRLRLTSSDALLASDRAAYFGYDARRKGTFRYDSSNADVLRMLPGKLTSDDTNVETSVGFTLDDLVISEFDSSGEKGIATYTSGSRANGTSATAVSGTHTCIIDQHGFNKFTVPMWGGHDGWDITQFDPVANRNLSGKTEKTSYAYNTIRRAVDAAGDPERVDFNLMVAPGVTDSSLTDLMINTCEERGDALAIIDLPNVYRSPAEATEAGQFTDFALRVGSVDQTVSDFKARKKNSSYACTYYPWVQIRDSLNSAVLWVPPSVVALGTFASSDRKADLWFAPAGFNRGGLSQGSSGLTVTNISERLTSDQRDKLYENNINPIASFPNEGIVIFGQKTLDASTSALNRINVRRLLIFLKKEVSRLANQVLFDQNVKATWGRFRALVVPLLETVKIRFGLSDYKMVLDETTTTPDLIDRNIMYAKIFLKPARAIEFIALDFIITRTGASFDD